MFAHFLLALSWFYFYGPHRGSGVCVNSALLYVIIWMMGARPYIFNSDCNQYIINGGQVSKIRTITCIDLGKGWVAILVEQKGQHCMHNFDFLNRVLPSITMFCGQRKYQRPLVKYTCSLENGTRLSLLLQRRRGCFCISLQFHIDVTARTVKTDFLYSRMRAFGIYKKGSKDSFKPIACQCFSVWQDLVACQTQNLTGGGQKALFGAIH